MTHSSTPMLCPLPTHPPAPVAAAPLFSVAVIPARVPFCVLSSFPRVLVWLSVFEGPWYVRVEFRLEAPFEGVFPCIFWLNSARVLSCPYLVWKEERAWGLGHRTSVWIFPLPLLTGCVISGKLLHFSELQSLSGKWRVMHGLPGFHEK